jgi:anthranilate synthase component 2
MNPRGILISPGPGAPEDSGIALQACAELGPRFPLFGVCMGHQCIGQVFGGAVVRAPTGLMHGKQSPVFHDPTDTGGLLEGMPRRARCARAARRCAAPACMHLRADALLRSPFMAARYHSLAIAREGFPEDALKITAWVEDGTIMGVRHRKYPWIQGVQFHPESIITDDGKRIIRNWLASLPPA